jgi:predicted ABC-type transport system involved in lysophospholipase L1 biosynthesis ATPase subunit
VLVTHDPHLAKRMNKILQLQDGALIQEESNFD